MVGTARCGVRTRSRLYHGGESFREKADYVLSNPVRAGLVERVEDWPYVFIAEW